MYRHIKEKNTLIGTTDNEFFTAFFFLLFLIQINTDAQPD